MSPSDERPYPGRRPTSPFLILLLGGAACALGAEWLRFQWGPVLAAAPAIVGGAVTLTAVSRAYRARRLWRRRRALADVTVAGATSAQGDAAVDGGAPIVVRAAQTERPAPWLASREEQGDARLGVPVADAVRPGARPRARPGARPGALRRADEGHAPTVPARGEDAREQERERESVRAARDDADRRRGRPRSD